jgi:hypothetical protein
VFSKKYRTIVMDDRGVGQTVITDGPFPASRMGFLAGADAKASQSL